MVVVMLERTHAGNSISCRMRPSSATSAVQPTILQITRKWVLPLGAYVDFNMPALCADAAVNAVRILIHPRSKKNLYVGEARNEM